MDSHQSISHAAVKNITAAIQKLTLVLKERDQNNQTFLRHVRAIENATKEIDRLSFCEIKIPDEVITADIRNRLGEIGINVETSNEQRTYKSPEDFVLIDIVRDRVKNLWANQYKIQWNTENGYPDPFSFYRFCENFQLELTYDLRKEHVMTRLWREKAKLEEISEWDYRQFCPPVYIRSENTWQKWNWDNNRKELVHEDTADDENIGWITNNALNDYLKNYSKTNADPNEKTGHLYWAVFEEDDFEDDNPHGDNFPGRTQVYVGESMHGIKGRWVGSGGTHCRNMLNACKCVCDMDNYDPTSSRYQNFKNFDLVHLRLLLHKACHPDGSTSGLFIMYTSDNETKLINAEKSNREGKKIDKSESIFPRNPTWKPKDMKYGLNKI